MKRSMKRVGFIIITLLLLITLSACDGNSAPKQTPDPSTAPESKAPENNSTSVETPVEPVTEDVGDGSFVLLNADWSGNLDNPAENEAVAKAITEKIKADRGYELFPKVEFYPGGEYAAKLSSILGMNPDSIEGFLMWYGWGGFAMYANEKELILPLDDLLEQYGQNLKKLIPESAWKSVTVDGQIVAIPDYWFGLVDTAFMRTDLIPDNFLGTDKKVPTTLSEMEKVMVHYKSLNMIPFSSAEFNVSKWLGASFGLPAYDYLDENGQYVRRELHPNYKYYLKTLNKWFNNGWLQKDYATVTWEQAQQDFIGGKTASTMFNYATFAGPTYKTMVDANPGMQLSYIPYLRADNVDGFTEVEPMLPYEEEVKSQIFLTKMGKNPENVIRFLDWRASAIENYVLCTNGIPEVHYTMDKGTDGTVKITQTDKYLDPNVKPYPGLFTLMSHSDLYPAVIPVSTDPIVLEGQALSKDTIDYMRSIKPNYSPTVLYSVQPSPEETQLLTNFYAPAAENVMLCITNKEADFESTYNTYYEIMKELFVEELQKSYTEKINANK